MGGRGRFFKKRFSFVQVFQQFWQGLKLWQCSGLFTGTNKRSVLHFSEFVLGSVEQHLEERKDALKTKAKEERERRILSPELLNVDRSPKVSLTSSRPPSASKLYQ